jgi:cell division protein FtsB
MEYGRLEVDFGVWSTVRKIALTVLAVGMLAGMVLWYIPALRQNQRLQREIEIKREALKRQQQLQQEYQEQIIALKTDPETVERVVREKLGLAKPNETIIHFEGGRSRQKP